MLMAVMVEIGDIGQSKFRNIHVHGPIHLVFKVTIEIQKHMYDREHHCNREQPWPAL